jgi:predicted nucleotidyltransferase
MRVPATRSPRLGRSEGPLATVLASGAMARLVTHFVLHPKSSLHFQALRRVTGLSTRSLQHELTRLVRLGLVQRAPDGRLIRYRATANHPGWEVFRSAVREFAGPAEVLRVALAQVPGVDAAFVYGSFARKTDVHPRSDVDVFVVGEGLDQKTTRLALAEEMLEASGALGREVNASRYTWERLGQRLSEGGRFVREVLAGPREWVLGDDSVLARLISRGGRRRAGSVAR